jgi:hypothetical protein
MLVTSIQPQSACGLEAAAVFPARRASRNQVDPVFLHAL